jgi:hypothetical protein
MIFTINLFCVNDFILPRLHRKVKIKKKLYKTTSIIYFFVFFLNQSSKKLNSSNK